MLIRNFEEKDREQYYKMSKSFYTTEAVLHKADEKNFKKNFDHIMKESPYIRGIIIELEGQAVGYALIAHTWSTEGACRVNVLEEFYIDESVRGRGYGTKCLEWIYADYPDTPSAFRLEVSPNNKRVMNLYSKMGFKPLEYLQMIRFIKH